LWCIRWLLHVPTLFGSHYRVEHSGFTNYQPTRTHNVNGRPPSNWVIGMNSDHNYPGCQRFSYLSPYFLSYLFYARRREPLVERNTNLSSFGTKFVPSTWLVSSN
jgi:hypothetical protein